MEREPIKLQTLRFIVSGLVTLFLMVIMALTLMSFSTSLYHGLWGIPVIIVSLLDIYFLTRSLLQCPKNVDRRLSTFIISIGATFGFSLVAILMDPSPVELPYKQTIQLLGTVLSILPYPFVIWALFCLKDCLTIVPEAHKVVAHGIYQYSRHPLYACYIVWAMADIMMFPTMAMVIASLAQIIFLVLRLRREERLLLATFPEYRTYYENTGIWGFMRMRRQLIACMANGPFVSIICGKRRKHRQYRRVHEGSQLQ